MFVRFRQTKTRLQVSLVETQWQAGKARHEHIASLGSCRLRMAILDQAAFWNAVDARLSRLSNRLDASACERIRNKITERVPVPSDEDRAAATTLAGLSPADIAHCQRMARVCNTIGDGYIKLLSAELERRQRRTERRLVRQLAKALQLE